MVSVAVAQTPLGLVENGDDFLSTATLSGLISAEFFRDISSDASFFQRIAFDAGIAPIPLLAGSILLISALVGLAVLKRRTKRSE